MEVCLVPEYPKHLLEVLDILEYFHWLAGIIEALDIQKTLEGLEVLVIKTAASEKMPITIVLLLSDSVPLAGKLFSVSRLLSATTKLTTSKIRVPAKHHE